MRQYLPVLIAALLTGCGSSPVGSSPVADAAPDTAPGGGYPAKVAALSPQLRAGVLFRAIRDAGQDCQQIVAADPAQAAGGPPAWVATCEDHRRWVVVIADNGTASVTDANLVARR